MKEWKASEKEAQKMTRDGAISVNMVTGEASHVSDRAPEQDYSPSGDSAGFVHSAAERLDDRRIHKSEKKKRRKQRRSYQTHFILCYLISAMRFIIPTGTGQR